MSRPRSLAPTVDRAVSPVLVAAGSALVAGLIVIRPAGAVLLMVACLAVWVAASVGVTPTGLLLIVVSIGSLISGGLQSRGLLPSGSAAALGAAALVAGLLVVVQVLTTPKSPSRLERREIVFLAGAWGFVGLCVVQVLNPTLPSISYGLAGLEPFLVPLVILFATRFATLSAIDVRTLLVAVSVCWGVNVIWALRQGLVGFSGGELEMLRSGGSTFKVRHDIRLLGAMRTNQDFGVIAAAAAPLVVAYALSATVSRNVRILAVLLVPGTLYVLVASLLRSTLVGGVAGVVAVLVLLLATAQSRRTASLIAGGAAVVVAVGALVLPGVQVQGDGRNAAAARRVTSIFDTRTDTSFQARTTSTWPVALHLIERHPLGAGTGSAGPVSQKNPNAAPFGEVSPDNGYLLIGIQLGLGGICGFLFFLLSGARVLFAAGRQGNTLAVGTFGAVVAILVAMVAGGLWTLVAPVSILCLLIGLATRPRHDVTTTT